MDIATAVIDELAKHDIDTVFGLPGIQTLPLNRAINGHGEMKFIMARHETAVSHQAWGYAQSIGQPAATLVVPGPGDINAMNGLKNALNDCVPLVHITAETESDLRGGEAIHEAPPDIYDDVVKHNVLVSTPTATIEQLRQAVSIALTSPRGPVRIGIPNDFLSHDAGHTDGGTYSTDTFDSLPDGITDATETLASAESVVIIAGGGIRVADAGEELRSVAEKLDAPVLTTRKGKGVFPEDHELSAGVLSKSIPELREQLADTEVALGVGTDFDAQATRAWSIPLPDRLIHVTIHPEEISRGYRTDIGLVGDAKAILTVIDAELDTVDIESSGGAEVVRETRETLNERLSELADVSEPPLTSVSALGTIRETLPRRTIISTDVGGFRTWTFLPGVFEVYAPCQQILPGSWGTMGTGLPAAIGAQVANPQTPVVALVGDGGLLMCVHELHTAVTEELPITVIVMNNNDYAIISEGAKQEDTRNGRGYTWNETPIDFVSLAESMGVVATHAGTPDAIRKEVTTALDADTPSLIEIPIDPNEPQVNWWLEQ